MKRIFLIFSILILGSILYSEDKGNFNGEFEAIEVQTDVKGNEAKFNEYRDLGNGFYGKLKLKIDSEKYFMKFNAYDMGYGTQNYEFEGGSFASYKIYLKYN